MTYRMRGLTPDRFAPLSADVGKAYIDADNAAQIERNSV